VAILAAHFSPNTSKWEHQGGGGVWLAPPVIFKATAIETDLETMDP
jgi:hypothetical protein